MASVCLTPTIICGGCCSDSKNKRVVKTKITSGHAAKHRSSNCKLIANLICSCKRCSKRQMYATNRAKATCNIINIIIIGNIFVMIIIFMRIQELGTPSPATHILLHHVTYTYIHAYIHTYTHTDICCNYLFLWLNAMLTYICWLFASLCLPQHEKCNFNFV